MPRHREPVVRQPTKTLPALPRWWSRLLDGAYQWGSFDATVGRYDVRHYRLIVYPPGTTTADRRLARMWRGWPATGAALGLLAILLLGGAAAPPDTVLRYAVLTYISIGALLFLRAGPPRVHVRSLSAILLPGSADAGERRKYAEWTLVVSMLTQADRALSNGAISLVEREAVWWEAYDRLGRIARG
ncbi:hypothetical protein MSAS_23120 [Mycobacterium saskatchewanense]|uniref:Uncharacterized protein n=1 Tax=Mycobacterium saskatchewanense TaxID=220927 RepID=A0AAJ3TUD3_9MYCO|nr:DUF6611 family protein [Mycobacterium saskatchewanense]ORW70439.1 hypothetical protein AWC23_17490 [Mycobacterium saskatchewanense]BBX63138.1 hypothetical protein MSAS_23120 [Mycobacterium saskatchewanense]